MCSRRGSAGVPAGGRPPGVLAPQPFRSLMLLVSLPGPLIASFGGEEVSAFGGAVGTVFPLVGVGRGGGRWPRPGASRGTRRSSAPFPGVAAFCYLPGKITARVRLSSRSVCLQGVGGVRDIFIIIIIFFCVSPPFPVFLLWLFLPQT